VKVCVIFTSDSDSMSPTGTYGLGELISNFISKAGGPRIVGPNCIGVYCSRSGVAFTPNFPKEPGKVAFISQSGGFAAELGWFGARIGLRFSKIVSYGNAVDLDLPDFLAYFREDSDTGVVAVYVEGVKDGRRTFKELTVKKPVLVWKGGITEEGAKAALSHTQSLAGSATLWSTMLKQAGAIQVESFEGLAYTSIAFSFYKPPVDNSVAIVSVSGGGAVASADTCTREGLLITRLSDTTINALRRVVPRFGTSIRNPVDAQRGALSPEACSEVLRIVLSDLNVSAVILV